jgi:Phasin protein.
MSDQSELAFDSGAFASPFHFYFSNLDAISQSASPMIGPMKALARWQLEAMGLLSRRAQAYIEIPARLSRCRSPQDLLSEQARFMQTAFQQYQESSKRMIDAWVQLMPLAFVNGEDSHPERDYISFADPKEANGRSRRPRNRHAA